MKEQWEETQEKLNKERNNQQEVEELIDKWEEAKDDVLATRQRERSLRLEIIALSPDLQAYGEKSHYLGLSDGRTIVARNYMNYRILTPMDEFFEFFKTLTPEEREYVKLKYEMDRAKFRGASDEIKAKFEPHLVKKQALTQLSFFVPYDKEAERYPPLSVGRKLSAD